MAKVVEDVSGEWGCWNGEGGRPWRGRTRRRLRGSRGRGGRIPGCWPGSCWCCCRWPASWHWCSHWTDQRAIGPPGRTWFRATWSRPTS
ncbi:hypothetical protein ACFFX0_07085 [Citricoccus parietis]|uniref:Uncharacterized protein n=1 Tax=Citricoccus parietis TaxID=592307 RepID=A0ABV5FWA8_9MICC